MDETAAYLFLAAVALIIVVIFLEVFRVISQKCKVDHSLSPLPQETAMCLSPDCIRCTRNKEILQSALTKLSYFSDDYRKELGDNDLETVTLDIRKSISLLKRKEQHYSVLRDKLRIRKSEISTSSPVVFKLSGLREEKVWSADDFPAVQILDKYMKDIALEFEHLYKSPLSETQSLWKTNETASGKWEIAQLIDQGRRTRAADFCPITMEALQKLPYLLSANIFGDVSFSVVHPGTEIATHCGSTNCRIRCHLGLKVPGDGTTFLQVADKKCHWQEGKLVCFSDAFPHSVHHQGGKNSSIRVVFMFDVWHPDITETQKKILNYAFGV